MPRPRASCTVVVASSDPSTSASARRSPRRQRPPAPRHTRRPGAPGIPRDIAAPASAAVMDSLMESGARTTLIPYFRARGAPPVGPPDRLRDRQQVTLVSEPEPAPCCRRLSLEPPMGVVLGRRRELQADEPRMNQPRPHPSRRVRPEARSSRPRRHDLAAPQGGLTTARTTTYHLFGTNVPHHGNPDSQGARLTHQQWNLNSNIRNTFVRDFQRCPFAFNEE